MFQLLLQSLLKVHNTFSKKNSTHLSPLNFFILWTTLSVISKHFVVHVLLVLLIFPLLLKKVFKHYETFFYSWLL